MAGGRPDSGNFLDDKQWLTTISQYDKEVGQWNKFRDVSSALSSYQPADAPSPLPLVPFLQDVGHPLGSGGCGTASTFPLFPEFQFLIICLRHLGGEDEGPAGQFPVRCRRGAAGTARRAPGRAGRPARTFGAQRAAPREPLPTLRGARRWRGRAAFVLPPPVSRPAAGRDAVGAPGRGRSSPRRRSASAARDRAPSLPGHLAVAPGAAASRRALTGMPAGRAGKKGQRSPGPRFAVSGVRDFSAAVRGVRSIVLAAWEQQPQPDPNLISYETCRCKVALSSECFPRAPSSGCICCKLSETQHICKSCSHFFQWKRFSLIIHHVPWCHF